MDLVAGEDWRQGVVVPAAELADDGPVGLTGKTDEMRVAGAEGGGRGARWKWGGWEILDFGAS